jgi:hypothetical protein
VLEKRQGRCPAIWEGIVTLIVYYLVFMILGDVADYGIGLATEKMFGSEVSLIVFLAFYFVSLWIAWLLAVRLTKPKERTAMS